MPLLTAAIRLELTGTLSAFTDFKLLGFGAPDAAIVTFDGSNLASNPAAWAVTSRGYWTPSAQACIGVVTRSGMASTRTWRISSDAHCAAAAFDLDGGSGIQSYRYQGSAITDGLRLTCTDAPGTSPRWCTVYLLRGINAKVITFTPAPSDQGTAQSPSIGFPPELVFASTIGLTAGTAEAESAVFSNGIGSKSLSWQRFHGSFWINGEGTTNPQMQLRRNRFTGVISSGVDWEAEVISWDADTFTARTHTTGGTGNDVVLCLVLGGSDLSYDVGELATPTTPSTQQLATTSQSRQLLTLTTTATAWDTHQSGTNGESFALGIAGTTANRSHGVIDESGQGTSFSRSINSVVYTIAAYFINGTREAESLYEGRITDSTPTYIEVTYDKTSGTSRIGFWVAFHGVVLESYDAGTATSLVEPQFTRLTDTDPKWQGDTVGIGSIDRNTGTNYTRDIIFLEQGTIIFPVENGTYDVIISVGDMALAHEQQVVWIEGVRYPLPDTATGQVIDHVIPGIVISDGNINMFFDDEGGPNAFVAFCGIVLIPKEPALAVAGIVKGDITLGLDGNTPTFQIGSDSVTVADVPDGEYAHLVAWIDGDTLLASIREARGATATSTFAAGSSGGTVDVVIGQSFTGRVDDLIIAKYPSAAALNSAVSDLGGVADEHIWQQLKADVVGTSQTAEIAITFDEESGGRSNSGTLGGTAAETGGTVTSADGAPRRHALMENYTMVGEQPSDTWGTVKPETTGDLQFVRIDTSTLPTGQGWVWQGNGTDREVEVQNPSVPATGTNDLSLFIRLKVETGGRLNLCFDKRQADGALQGLLFGVQADNTVQLYMRSDLSNQLVMTTTGTITADGLWHSFGAAIDRDVNARLFIDGVFDSAHDVSSLDGESAANTNNGTIGGPAPGLATSWLNFAGQLADFRVWQAAALSDDQMQWLHDLATGIPAPTPDYHWMLDESPGRIAK